MPYQPLGKAARSKEKADEKHSIASSKNTQLYILYTALTFYESIAKNHYTIEGARESAYIR